MAAPLVAFPWVQSRGVFSCLAVVACPLSLFPPLLDRFVFRVGCGPVGVDAATCTQWACEW